MDAPQPQSPSGLNTFLSLITKQTYVRRIVWIDYARGIAMFFVVFSHMKWPTIAPVAQFISSFHMPIFFVISGMVFTPKQKTFLQFLNTKTRDLLFPFIAMNAVCFPFALFINNYVLMKPVNAADLFYTFFVINHYPSYPTWFIICLFFVEMTFYWIFKLSKGNKIIVGIICAILTLTAMFFASLANQYVIQIWHWNSVFTALIFYFSGVLFIALYRRGIYALRKRAKFLLGCLLLALGIWIQVSTNLTLSMDVHVYSSPFLNVIEPLCITFSVCFFCQLLSDNHKTLSFIGKNTIVCLGYHMIMQAYVTNLFMLLYVNIDYQIILVLLIMAIFVPLIAFIDDTLPIARGKFNEQRHPLVCIGVWLLLVVIAISLLVFK
jgi:fucose 4-O-acetylase-like acetyltransferase